ncbi:hypothetical protein QJS66_22700 [Kocuria rhizophila]|nr:hypothetical protein QJS66_22700 [Kocuria rhizophila]
MMQPGARGGTAPRPCATWSAGCRCPSSPALARAPLRDGLPQQDIGLRAMAQRDPLAAVPAGGSCHVPGRHGRHPEQTVAGSLFHLEVRNRRTGADGGAVEPSTPQRPAFLKHRPDEDGMPTAAVEREGSSGAGSSDTVGSGRRADSADSTAAQGEDCVYGRVGGLQGGCLEPGAASRKSARSNSKARRGKRRLQNWYRRGGSPTSRWATRHCRAKARCAAPRPEHAWTPPPRATPRSSRAGLQTCWRTRAARCTLNRSRLGHCSCTSFSIAARLGGTARPRRAGLRDNWEAGRVPARISTAAYRRRG